MKKEISRIKNKPFIVPGHTSSEISAENLRRLQLVELEILIEFDRVCRKNNISYCLGCGTLLGAIRHKGFIPWDDDVDVWMIRSEYDRFCKICEKELDEKFFFQNWDNDPFFNSAYGKVRKKGTRYIRAGQEKMKFRDGIYIDVLPLDNLPDQYWARWEMIVKAWFYRKLTYAKAGSMCERNLLKRTGFLILSLYPVDIAKKNFNRLLMRYNNIDTLYCKCLGDVNFNPHWKDDFRELIEWEFEGHNFFVPARYDSLLKNNIGIDYMKIPSPEKQRPHADASYIYFGDEES
jgi:lipopolysaccharide cholinephosphotransferase